MAKDNQPKIVTKKHLARLERERLQRRYILLGSIAVIVIAVGALIYGLLDQIVIKPSRPVAVVNGERISTGDFASEVRYYRQNLVSRYQQGYEVYAMFAQSDPTTASYFTSQLQQYKTQLDDSTGLAQQVLDAMIEDAIVRQEAEKLGLTVSDEELLEYIQGNFQYYPNGTPTSVPTDLPTAPLPTLSTTQLALVTATPTITPTATPTATLVATATYTPAPTLAPTEVLTPTATPTPYTEDLFNKDYQSYLDGVKTGANVKQQTVEDVVRTQILRDKLIKAMFADLPREQEQVWLRQIFVATEDIIQTANERLQAGEDFAALAAELSTDATAVKGGDMGWQTADTLDPAIADVAFGMETGEISDIIQTETGWVIIQMIGKQTKVLSQSEYDALQQSKYTEWFTQTKTDMETAGTLTINTDQWQANIPTRPSIPAGMELPTPQPQQ